jgi:hypothetical protein
LYQQPYFKIDTDDFDDKGYCELKINPELFEDFRASKKGLEEKQNLERAMRSLPPKVSFNKDRSSEIPAVSFKPIRGIWKLVDGTNTDPNIKAPKKRWSGMPGVD